MDKWEIIGKLKSSPKKRKILEMLKKSMTHTEIYRLIDVKSSNTSGPVHEIVDMGLIEVLTPKEMEEGRIFALTVKERKILKEM